MHVEIRNGVIENKDPDTIVGHVAVPIAKWLNDIPYA